MEGHVRKSGTVLTFYIFQSLGGVVCISFAFDKLLEFSQSSPVSHLSRSWETQRLRNKNLHCLSFAICALPHCIQPSCLNFLGFFQEALQQVLAAMLSCPKGDSLTRMGTSKGEGTVSFLCCLALAFGVREERHSLVLIEMWPSVRQKTCQGHLVTFL